MIECLRWVGSHSLGQMLSAVSATLKLGLVFFELDSQTSKYPAAKFRI